MENKRRGRPCKEEKTVPFHFRMNTDDHLRLLRLSKYLKVSQAEAMRMALDTTYDRLFSSNDDYAEDYFEEEGEEAEDFM